MQRFKKPAVTSMVIRTMFAKIAFFLKSNAILLLVFPSLAFFAASIMAVFDSSLGVNNFSKTYTSIKDEVGFAPSTMVLLDSSVDNQNAARVFLRYYYNNLDKSLLGTKFDSISFPYFLLNNANNNGLKISNEVTVQKSIISTAIYQPQKVVINDEEMYFIAGTKIRTHNSNKSVTQYENPGKLTFITDSYADEIISGNDIYSSYDDILEIGYSFFAYSDTNSIMFGSDYSTKKYTVANIVYTQKDGAKYGYDGYDLFKTNGDFVITSDLLLYNNNEKIEGLILSTNADYNEYSNSLVFKSIFNTFSAKDYNYSFSVNESQEKVAALEKSFSLYIDIEVIRIANIVGSSVFGALTILLFVIIRFGRSTQSQLTNSTLLTCGIITALVFFLINQLVISIFNTYVYGFSSLLLSVLLLFPCGFFLKIINKKTSSNR